MCLCAHTMVGWHMHACTQYVYVCTYVAYSAIKHFVIGTLQRRRKHSESGKATLSSEVGPRCGCKTKGLCTRSQITLQWHGRHFVTRKKTFFEGFIFIFPGGKIVLIELNLLNEGIKLQRMY